MVGSQVNLRFLLCHADIASDIQVIVVVSDFFETHTTAVTILFGACAICLHNLIDVLRQQLVLLLTLLKVFSSIDEEHIVALATFLQNYDAHRNAS